MAGLHMVQTAGKRSGEQPAAWSERSSRRHGSHSEHVRNHRLQLRAAPILVAIAPQDMTAADSFACSGNIITDKAAASFLLLLCARKERKVLSRLLNLLKGKLNKGMAQLETPEVLAEQAQQELESSVKKVKEAVITSLTTEKSLEQQIKKSTDEVSTWEKRAAVAVGQNNDDVARQCLQKKQELVQNLAALNAQLEAQKQSTAQFKARHAEIEQQMREFQQKKAGLIARGQASDATARANQLLSATGGSGTAKWEQKIQEKEFKAEAQRQLGSDKTADQFAQLDQKFQVEDDLAALKQQISTPKIIVDTGGSSAPGKTVVDDNVPMVVEEEKKDDKKRT